MSLTHFISTQEIEDSLLNYKPYHLLLIDVNQGNNVNLNDIQNNNILFYE